MGRLLVYLKPYWRTVLVSVGFLFLQSSLQIAGPLITKTAIDRYLLPGATVAPSGPLSPNHWFSGLGGFTGLSADPWTGLTQLSLLYLIAVVLGFLCDFGETYLMQRTGQYAMFDLRRDLMAKLQQLDISYFDRNPVGRLITRVTTDVDVLNDLFASGLVTIIGDLLMLSFVILTMFQLSPPMTGLLLAVMPLVIITTQVFRRAVTSSYRRTRVAVAKINAYMQEHVTGMSVLQLFNREARSREEFDRVNAEHMLAFKDSVIAYGWFYPVVEFLGMLSLALLLAYGGYQVHDKALSLGVLIAFFQYGMRFFRPIQDLSEKYNILQSAMAASERVFKLLDTEVSIESGTGARMFPEGPAAIEFDHVWFAYSGEDWVLRDVSFRIEPGETIAVVGHTGAGKTTLTNLLLRFYDIQKGAIRIGGVDLREFRLDELRRQFSIVLQDPYLFTGTISSNIRLGTSVISDQQIEDSARQVNLSDFVSTLPNRYEQSVRERGGQYSTGQKQLISFARALAHDPRFLILDEATSSVDTDTELKIRSALEALVSGRTSIVIAHRLSTVQRASRIFVMHKGQLRESGTHQELVAARGIYWKLYQLQYKDQELPLISPSA